MGRKRLKKDVRVSKSQDAVDKVNALFRRRGVTTKERNMIWNVMAEVCMIHLEHKKGPFYEVAARRLKEFRKRSRKVGSVKQASFGSSEEPLEKQ